MRNRTSRRFLAATVAAIFLSTGVSADAGIPQARPDPLVESTGRFELRSDPRVALHHLLVAWASAEAGEWPRYAERLTERDDWRSGLDPQAQAEWSASVDAYSAAVGRSLLFDEGMLAVRAWAAGAGSLEAVGSADRQLVDAIERALPIYLRHWWPVHDVRNREWIESVVPTLAAVEEAMIARFEAAYGGSWPAGAIPVDVMVYANPVGAYSTGGRLTISSAPFGNQMPHALEMIFHEASHTDPLEPSLRTALSAVFRSVGAAEPDRFWHDVLFFTAGEITRLVLAERGDPGYQHYGTLGVYRRGERWATQLPAFEAHWRPFLQSRSSDGVHRRQALIAVVEQLQEMEATGEDASVDLDALIEEFREIGRGPIRQALEAAANPERSGEDPLDAYRSLLGRARALDVSSLTTAEAVDRAYLIGLLETDIRATEARIARPSGQWAIGKELYDFIIRRRWFLDADADEIIARGRRAFEEIEAEAQRVAGRIRPGADWVEVYESLKDDHPPADAIKEAYQAQMDAAREFVIAHDIVTLPEGERVITVDTPEEQRRNSPYGTFDSVDPFGEELQGRLVLTPIEDWMTPEQRAERLRAHHDTWVPIIAVHEAYPGHHVQALKLRENLRPLRRLARESITSEGWGLFTEQLMWDLGFLQGDEVYLTILRNRLWRAARVILDASLHTGKMTIEEAESFLVERVRFDPYAAELEVGMYPRRPTYVLGYLIGMQEIAAIRDEWVARNGEPDPPSELWDAFLTIGSIPPALIRAELLGEPVPER